MGQRRRKIQREACELVPLQCQDLQLVETLKCPRLDGTDAVVLQIQAGEVPQVPQGARGNVSDAVFLQQQGLQAGRQATGEAGQQVVTEAQLLQAREGPEEVVHVTELVPGHRQGRGTERDVAGE